MSLKLADAQNTTSAVRCYDSGPDSASAKLKHNALVDFVEGNKPKWESANLFCSVTISAATVNLVRGIDFLKVPEWSPLNAEAQLSFLTKKNYFLDLEVVENSLENETLVRVRTKVLLRSSGS